MARLHALVWGLLVCVFCPGESLSPYNRPNRSTHKRSGPWIRVPVPRVRAHHKIAVAMEMMMERKVNFRLRKVFRAVKDMLLYGQERALLDKINRARKPSASSAPVGNQSTNLVETFLKMSQNGGSGELGETEQKQVHRMSDFTVGFLDGMVSMGSEKCLYTRFDPMDIAKNVESLSEDPLTAIAGLWKVLSPLKQDTRDCQNYAHDVIDTVDSAAKSGTAVMSNLLFHLGKTMVDLRAIEGDVLFRKKGNEFDIKKLGVDVGNFVHLGMTGQSTHASGYVPQHVKASKDKEKFLTKTGKGITDVFNGVVSNIKTAIKSARLR